MAFALLNFGGCSFITANPVIEADDQNSYFYVELTKSGITASKEFKQYCQIAEFPRSFFNAVLWIKKMERLFCMMGKAPAGVILP